MTVVWHSYVQKQKSDMRIGQTSNAFRSPLHRHLLWFRFCQICETSPWMRSPTYPKSGTGRGLDADLVRITCTLARMSLSNLNYYLQAVQLAAYYSCNSPKLTHNECEWMIIISQWNNNRFPAYEVWVFLILTVLHHHKLNLFGLWSVGWGENNFWRHTQWVLHNCDWYSRCSPTNNHFGHELICQLFFANSCFCP